MSAKDLLDLAEILKRKGAEDAVALRELVGTHKVADSIVGFHAQQAIEKWLKSAIAAQGISPEHTHDLGRLLQILEKHDVEMPDFADTVEELTVYAVPYRYDEFADAERLDRQETLQVIEAFEIWINQVVRS